MTSIPYLYSSVTSTNIVTRFFDMDMSTSSNGFNAVSNPFKDISRMPNMDVYLNATFTYTDRRSAAAETKYIYVDCEAENTAFHADLILYRYEYTPYDEKEFLNSLREAITRHVIENPYLAKYIL
jgi:hypothetical protein